MHVFPATAWLLAPPTATCTPRPAVPRTSWATAYSSNLFQQQSRCGNSAVRRLETGIGRRGVLMFGTTVARAAGGSQEKEEPLWLGLDLSTQSLTAAVLRGDGVGRSFNEPVVLESINYEVRAAHACRSILGV